MSETDQSNGPSTSCGNESTQSNLQLTLNEMKSLEQFHILEELGEGSYSTVYLASTKKGEKRFALKICSKLKIQREKKVQQIFRERDALRLLSEQPQPFVVQLLATFHDDSSLYFVLSYARYRDLGKKMEKCKKFDVETSRFVVAELVMALAYIHSKRILHRDVKPQNILIKENFHIMLTDFGCCITFDEKEKNEKSERKRKTSFVGSGYYVSPEVLSGKVVDETCDYFACGSVLFEMLVGRTPFFDVSEYLVFQRIANNRYKFEDDFPDSEAKNVIREFLRPQQTERLGSPSIGGFDSIRDHAFFSSIDWNELNNSPSPLSSYYSSTK
ncbi:Non-specific serine/threonine protein kinase [Aphelenchoides besseyi]|nr:Non-specific serine/threonine protein kinase [Aphelenchoides besseyi]